MKAIIEKIGLLILLLGLALFTTTSCDDDDDDDNSVVVEISIVDIATETSDLSSLVAALTKANLVNTLEGAGPFTVFAPTNAAFADLFDALGVNGIEDIPNETLTPILLYHVLGGEFESGDLSSGYVQTLSTNTTAGNYISLLVEVNDEIMLNNDTKVISEDIMASNGVVHLIDKVLLPPNVVDIAIANSSFSHLVAAVLKAGLAEALSGTGPFTVLAPTDAAFEELFEALGVNGIDDISEETLIPILLYHVLGIEATSGDLTTGYVETLSSNSSGDYPLSLLVELDNGVFFNNETQVLSADIVASNGVIHAIDKVLLPPNVVEIAIANSTFSHLVAAVVKADLVETLSGDGPFTIFAPTDDAFEALFEALGITGIEDLTAEDLVPILTYHVVSGNIRAADVTAGMVETLNAGNNLDITISNSSVIINGDTQVIATDVQGINGVIHVIDKVLLP